MGYLYAYVTTSAFGVIVWALRLEGRINTADQKYLDLKELINTKFDSVSDRLERIERSLNGYLHAKE